MDTTSAARRRAALSPRVAPAGPGTAAARRSSRAAAQRRFLLRAALLLIIVAAVGVLVVAAAGFALIARDVPSPQTIAARHQFQSTKILDRNGVQLHEVYDPDKGKRVVVPLQQIPESVVNAFLAAEDARFYRNSGIDLQSILRAFKENATGGGDGIQGGSTITQQLVKYSLLTSEQTMTRKFREASLAIAISRRYSKDQILEMYLNSVYLGSQAYGVQSAADTYFGKTIENLNQAEAALLAGLPRSPSSTNPFADQSAAKAEQQRVLDAMVLHGFLNRAQADEAAALPLNYNSKQYSDIKAPHLVIWVREQLESNPKYGKKGLLEQGLEVTTTIDVRMQEMAELIVRDHVSKLGALNVTNGALVALNPQTGEILAMVGSADYNNKAIQGEVNVALALRQPGSSIKPITYLGAFTKGWNPATVIDDVPTTFPGIPPFAPKNYDGQFHGKVSVRTALANSYNIPAVKALQFVSVPAAVDLARKMGITTFQDPQKYGLALTLGGGEVRLLDLTSAYGVLANGGNRVDPVSILKVTDHQGKLLDQFAGARPVPVVDAMRAYMITSILADNAARTPAFGPNSPLKLSRPAAVKTGTTDDYKDNWTVGYTSQIVTGVWVGNARNDPMRGTTGITGAAPIWHDFMEYALKPLPVDPLPQPQGLERISITKEGKLWVEGCPEPVMEDYVVPGQGPAEKCEVPTPEPTQTPLPVSPTAEVTTSPTAAPTRTLTADEARIAATSTAAEAARRTTPAATPATPATATAARVATQAPATATRAPVTATQPPAPTPVPGTATVRVAAQPTAPPATATRVPPTATQRPAGGIATTVPVSTPVPPSGPGR